jgi:hypothetical protein
MVTLEQILTDLSNHGIDIEKCHVQDWGEDNDKSWLSPSFVSIDWKKLNQPTTINNKGEFKTWVVYDNDQWGYGGKKILARINRDIPYRIVYDWAKVKYGGTMCDAPEAQSMPTVISVEESSLNFITIEDMLIQETIKYEKLRKLEQEKQKILKELGE